MAVTSVGSMYDRLPGRSCGRCLTRLRMSQLRGRRIVALTWINPPGFRLVAFPSARWPRLGPRKASAGSAACDLPRDADGSSDRCRQPVRWPGQGAKSIARPLIAQRQIEIAELTGADAVAHGATGKGTDSIISI